MTETTPVAVSDPRVASIGTVEPEWGVEDPEALSAWLWGQPRIRETRIDETIIAVVADDDRWWVLYSDGSTSFGDGYESMGDALAAYADIVAATSSESA